MADYHGSCQNSIFNCGKLQISDGKVTKTAPTGENYKEVVEGYSVFDKEVYIPGDFVLTNEYILKEKDFEPQKLEGMEKIHFGKLDPGEFRIYELKRI